MNHENDGIGGAIYMATGGNGPTKPPKTETKPITKPKK